MGRLGCLLSMLLVLNSAAQTVVGLSSPNWLNVSETDTRKLSVFASLTDIGSLGECTTFSAAVAAERRIIEVDLQYVYGSICVPLPDAGLGISLSHVSLDAWKQSKLGLSYGRKLASGFSLAIQVNYHRISVAGYGAAGALTPAIGMNYHLTAKTAFRVFADNPYGGNLGKTKERIGSLFTSMLAHKVSEKLALALRISREQSATTDVSLLLNYAMQARLRIDGGISLNRANGFAGTSVSFRQIKLRQILSWSQAYGFGTAIIFEFRKPVRDE
jgi:hypothetical protein